MEDASGGDTFADDYQKQVRNVDITSVYEKNLTEFENRIINAIVRKENKVIQDMVRNQKNNSQFRLSFLQNDPSLLILSYINPHNLVENSDMVWVNLDTQEISILTGEISHCRPRVQDFARRLNSAIKESGEVN